MPQSFNFRVSNAGPNAMGCNLSWEDYKKVGAGSVQFEEKHAKKLGFSLGGLTVVFDIDKDGKLIGIEVV